jgi:hypothetical protein
MAVVIVLLLSFFSLAHFYFSLQGKPDNWYPVIKNEDSGLREGELIRGWASLDRDSYLIGELASYSIRLLWRNDKLSPDTETFKNGIGFFPFNRLEISERTALIAGNVTEYNLQFQLHAVDVEPAQSYVLSPPTIYFTNKDNDTGELSSYRLDAPQVHIGEYYPQNVSKIPLLAMKGKISNPAGMRGGGMALIGLLLAGIAIGLLWFFGRVRLVETLSEPERIWREFENIKTKGFHPREFLTHCEFIFTDLLMYKLEMNPGDFWSGQKSENTEWAEIVERARDIFYQGYLKTEPGSDLLNEITNILDSQLSNLVEEEKLKIEILPTFSARLAKQPVLVSFCFFILLASGILFILSINPMKWSSSEINEYNRIVDVLNSNDLVEEKYEEITNYADIVDDERVKAIAYYNAGTFSATPELVSQDIYQQEALLEVMFQEQRVFLDALMHSLAMEDPFLLVGMIRDGIRFMTQGESALKFAVRLNPNDIDYRRNLELIQKRRNAYAETVTELLQEGEQSSEMGELQRQTLMDLEQFMQMEMPDEFAELKEGKNDKDYFILEGF